MKIQESRGEETPNTAPRSRFAYHGDDDPGEGGVRTTRPAKAATTTINGPRVATSAQTPGIPGPDEPLLEISELVRTVGMRYTHRFEFPPGRLPEITTVAPTVGSIRLTNTGAILLLRGEVSSVVQMECGRCLTPTDLPVETEIEEEFALVATNNAFRQEEVHAVDEDAPAAVIQGNVLNLADLLRQSLLLAAPLQPLCSEDCPGITYDGGEGETVPVIEEEAVAEAPVDNPLKHLAELLEAKRRQES